MQFCGVMLHGPPPISNMIKRRHTSVSPELFSRPPVGSRRDDVESPDDAGTGIEISPHFSIAPAVGIDGGRHIGDRVEYAAMAMRITCASPLCRTSQLWTCARQARRSRSRLKAHFDRHGRLTHRTASAYSVLYTQQTMRACAVPIDIFTDV
jgi:hypothetical protein